jgi:Tfp pilus assembly protein PilN
VKRATKTTKMKALRIDFCRSPPSPRWLAPLLLAVAVAFAGDVGFSFFSGQLQLRKNEASLAKLDPRTYKTAKNASAEEIAAARETLQRLSTPWDKLFSALESAASEQVALLAIEPDPRAGTVVISGDSKDYLAALTYVLNLSRAETLSQVKLARHEVKNDPQKTVAFSVSAQWSAKQ